MIVSGQQPLLCRNPHSLSKAHSALKRFNDPVVIY